MQRAISKFSLDFCSNIPFKVVRRYFEYLENASLLSQGMKPLASEDGSVSLLVPYNCTILLNFKKVYTF